MKIEKIFEQKRPEIGLNIVHMWLQHSANNYIFHENLPYTQLTHQLKLEPFLMSETKIYTILAKNGTYLHGPKMSLNWFQ